MYIHNIVFWLSKFLRCMPQNDKEYLEQLGKNIKAKRKKLKMSQADLAYKVGICHFRRHPTTNKPNQRQKQSF